MATGSETRPRAARIRRGSVPCAETASFGPVARRTTVVRVGLAAALASLLLLAVWNATRLAPQQVAFVPREGDAVLVLDVSKSVYVDAYRRVRSILEQLAASEASIGLIVFSDTAYELVPPRAHASHLRPLVRYFTPRRGYRLGEDPTARFPVTPWSETFSSGTQISAGLDLARSALEREASGRGTIVLVSDLEAPSEDMDDIARALLMLRERPEMRLRIITLPGSGRPKAVFERLAGRSAFVDPDDVELTPGGGSRASRVRDFPTTFVVLGGLALLLLAVNELWGNRLFVPRARVGVASS